MMSAELPSLDIERCHSNLKSQSLRTGKKPANGAWSISTTMMAAMSRCSQGRKPRGERQTMPARSVRRPATRNAGVAPFGQRLRTGNRFRCRRRSPFRPAGVRTCPTRARADGPPNGRIPALREIGGRSASIVYLDRSRRDCRRHASDDDRFRTDRSHHVLKPALAPNAWRRCASLVGPELGPTGPLARITFVHQIVIEKTWRSMQSVSDRSPR